MQIVEQCYSSSQQWPFFFYSVAVEQHRWTSVKQIWLYTKGIAVCLKCLICFRSRRRFLSIKTALRDWKTGESALSHFFLLCCSSVKAGWWQVLNTFSPHLCTSHMIQQRLPPMQTHFSLANSQYRKSLCLEYVSGTADYEYFFDFWINRDKNMNSIRIQYPIDNFSYNKISLLPPDHLHITPMTNKSGWRLISAMVGDLCCLSYLMQPVSSSPNKKKVE